MASVPVDADPTDLVPVQAENESEGGQEGDSLRKPFYLSCHGASLTHSAFTRQYLCSLSNTAGAFGVACLCVKQATASGRDSQLSRLANHTGSLRSRTARLRGTGKG